MTDPAVVVAMREFKRGLLLRERAQMAEMAARWLDVEGALEAEIGVLADEFSQEKEAGRATSRAKLYRMGRYRRLLGQVERELGEYADWAAGEVERGQGELARLGLRQAGEAIRLSYPGGIGVYFDRLPVEAVENMVGLAGNGRPVGELLRARMVGAGVRGMAGMETWERLVGTLVRGTGLGWNPRKTARGMRDDLTGGLQKALVIARTEQMRVYQEVSRAQYEASGVVMGQKRLTAHDDRVCGACIADEGRMYGLDEVISDHPNGRCTSVPVVRGLPEVEWLSGEAWFRQQPVETQRSILGNGRYEAWEEGAFEFGDLVSRSRDATWGAVIRPAPLQDLVN